MENSHKAKPKKEHKKVNGLDKASKPIKKVPKQDKKNNSKKPNKNKKHGNNSDKAPARDESLFIKAQRIYEQREREALEKGLKKAERSLMKKIMESGTHADKISALSIRIRDHPKFPIEPLVKLLAMTRDHNRRRKLLAVGTLKELFLDVLLPKKKLNSFPNFMNTVKDANEDQLSDAFKEHRLRELYQVFLGILEQGLKDELDFFKETVTVALGDLLKSKPEQEEFILSLLVNKFGDKSKKYITGLNKVLNDLLFKHKSMAGVVAKEIEGFINRPNIGNDALFYAAHFLCTLNFQTFETPILQQLSKFFFKLFFKLADQKEDENEKVHKLQGVLLKAINKIFPKIYESDPSTKETMNEHIDQLFRMTHQTPLKIRIQSLVLLFQFMKLNSALNDRFYRVLYELLLAEDISVNHSNQVLFDLLYNAIKEDYSVTRVKAFLKRLMQVAMHTEPSFIIASLLLVARMFQVHPGALSLIKFSEHNKLNLVDDEEEIFRDAPDEDDDVVTDGIQEERKEAPKVSNFLLANNGEEKKSFSTEYDPNKREPLYCNADNSVLFELLLLKEHYHPTVKLYANAILEDINKNSALLDYKGNPLLDFSTSNFLDRISFKKPKKVFGKKTNKMRMSKLAAPISETFTSEENFREDEEYFTKYFQNKTPRRKDKRPADFDEEADIDAYADELFEKQLQAANVDGDGEDDDDDLEWDDDEDMGDDEDIDEGEYDDEDENTFGDILENIGEGENDFDEEEF